MWARQRSAYHDLVQAEARAFIEAHGDRAYQVAREVMRLARSRNDQKSEKHFSQIALQIARLTNREIGLDTATRYLE
jgi:hypothetical protein